MIRKLGLATATLLVTVNALHAQTLVPTDSTGRHEVTKFSIKSGNLALSSTANPGPVVLADGSYANEANTAIVVIDGRISRIEYASGTVSQVSSARVQRYRVMLTPPVGALMAVSPFPLPSGTFTSEDGAMSFTVMSGRPTEFTIRESPPKPETPIARDSTAASRPALRSP